MKRIDFRNNNYTWVGLSTDTKPNPDDFEENIDGSLFFEADTSTVYMLIGEEWFEV